MKCISSKKWQRSFLHLLKPYVWSSSKTVNMKCVTCSSGMKHDSAVQITGCSCRGARFASEHPHGSSQTFVTPVPKDLKDSVASMGTRPHIWYTCKQTIQVHKRKKREKRNNLLSSMPVSQEARSNTMTMKLTYPAFLSLLSIPVPASLAPFLVICSYDPSLPFLLFSSRNSWSHVWDVARLCFWKNQTILYT